jgi:hypothetical protein
MMAMKLLLIAPLGILGACAPRVSGSVAVDAPAYVAAPGLAYVAPGVEVVSDWDTPVFFADDFFWYWDGGVWFRGSVLGGERVRVREVPSGIARIQNPGGYAHFGAAQHASRPMPAGRFRGERIASHRR